MRGKQAAKGSIFKWASLLTAALSLFFAGLPVAATVMGGGSGEAQAVKPEAVKPLAEPSNAAVQAFYSAAEALYDSVRKGDRLGGTRALQEVERSLRKLPMSRIPNAEGIGSLAASVAEMKRAWAAVSPDEARIEQAAGSVRMAADALANPSRPLWHQYQTVLSQDSAALIKAIEDGGSPKDALERLTRHYGIIRAAASLQAEPSAIERMDSVLRYADRLLSSGQPQSDLANDLGRHIQDAIAGLFPQAEGSPTNVVPLAPPSWGITATIGSFIITILSWAGWRRFRFERMHPGRRSEASKNRSDAANRWFR